MATLQGKSILLTGGASGIGLDTAKLLLSKGANLVVGDFNEEALNKVSDEIRAAGKGKVILQTVDVRERSQVRNLVETAVKEFGGLDGCANIAGTAGSLGSKYIWEMDGCDYDTVMDVNAKGVFYCLAEELKPGVLVEGASIVNVASILSLRGVLRSSAYIASKHAVQGLTKAAAIDAAERGIRVNCVAPGHVDTPMLSVALEQKFGSDPDKWPNPTTPFPRRGKPAEIGAVIAFLLCDEASFVTGSTYTVDGGWNCS
ncbi:uncharacterized protein A1O9_06935 [Exophiala aquamarina CBS 119918]|uniref:Glucose 1-dehydrogenase n=1 Tax=Exophiala aquamarina CBS 119918 TaxID=1182545 RepID=A0A072PMK2_9EURO|nr:uncharacterized protein A1O9_06935 [Exophiala aquamarina CBS 119918]KEF56745.1 hypothetical protein A1O9_06935 [Exophiala aquamarina CBS 119918]